MAKKKTPAAVPDPIPQPSLQEVEYTCAGCGVLVVIFGPYTPPIAPLRCDGCRSSFNRSGEQSQDSTKRRSRSADGAAAPGTSATSEKSSAKTQTPPAATSPSSQESSTTPDHGPKAALEKLLAAKHRSGEQCPDPTPTPGSASSMDGSTPTSVTTRPAAGQPSEPKSATGSAGVPSVDLSEKRFEQNFPTLAAKARAESTLATETSLTQKPAGRGVIQTTSGGGLAAMLAQGQAREQAAESREPPHLIVVAKAGTGKTTTLVAGMQVMKGLPPTNAKGDPITPSPQQAAVWDAMMLSRGERRVGFCAFNNSIAGELKRRVPPGCDAMTVHGMGFGAVNRAFRSLGDPNKDRVTNIISELLGIEIRLLRREKPILLAATDELVRLCKMTLAGWDNNGMVTDDELLALTDRYDIDLGEHAAEVFQLVPAVLERCMDVQKDGYIDFNDMVWLPLVLDLPIKVYDVLLGDEVQDWNRCQQELVKKAGRRLILCGDPNQAIYGFSGADSESMKRLETDLRGGKLTCPRCHNADKYRPGCDACGATGLVGPGRGVQVLPLTVTRRCGKKIVERAQKFVSGFSAHESNPDGKVLFAKYTEESANPSGNYWTGGDEAERRTKPVPIEKTYIPLVRDGDMVVCRTNAPLVSQCFKFLKAGRKATIQGRKDIGKGIKDLIDKLKPESVVKLVEKVSDWGHEEASKELAKRNPDDARLISIYDRVECLICFTEGAKTVDDVMRKIDSIFTDEMQPQGIRLSSIHKAKGLESTRVFFLQPRGSECPHPRAADRGGWQYEQERNLAYVAITRAIEELYYVS